MTAPADELAIDLHDVAKTYGRKVHALRGINLEVHRGEIFGLLGPNGAGKSTLIKIMTTVVRPSRASGTILGKPLGHRPTLARVGYLPEQPRLAPYLTGRQVIDYYGRLLKVPRRTRKRRTGELLETVGMTRWADKEVAGYSKGMVQRIALAQAFVNEPDLIMLDEPTEGLDPLGRRHIRHLLVRLREQGKTVFLNSHLLSETERVCDRVAILVEGKVVRQGRLEDLTRQTQGYRIETGADDEALRAALRGAAAEDQLSISAGAVRFAQADPARVQPLIDALRQAGICIISLQQTVQSLEDLFVEVLGDRQDSIGAIQAGKRELKKREAAEGPAEDRGGT